MSWYEDNFRDPQINCLNIAKSRSEPWDSPDNRRLARATTTLRILRILTAISNFTANYSTKPYWSPFFDAPLGRSIGGDETKGVLYETPKGEKIEGLFIREFTNGWAVYNRVRQASSGSICPKRSPAGRAVSKTSIGTPLADMDGEIYIKSVATPEDVNGDGIVNILDLVIVANGFRRERT